VLLLAPLAARFQRSCLALATFAPQQQRGQYSPDAAFDGELGLTMFCLSPGVDLTPQFSVLPSSAGAWLLRGCCSRR